MKTARDNQIELEKLYNKNQTVTRLVFYFQKEHQIDFDLFFKLNQIDIKFGYNLLVQIALHRRTDLPTLVGIMRHHFNDSQMTTNMILKGCELDMLDWVPEFRQFVVKPELQIPPELQKELDLFQYPLPMIVEPNEIKSNSDSGYLLGSSSVILKNNHHDEDVCLDHLNTMNKIKFTINVDTARMIANAWRDLDKKKDGETPDDFEKRKRAFERYDATSHQVINIMEQCGNEFYLTHKYDKRGRIYCQGYHVNYQGNAWNKAVIELADQEVVELL